MASSLNPTKKLRVNGQLVETSDEELNNLAKKQGLPSTPTSPAGAAGVGASPDAAKMAGSRLQKSAVQEQRVGPQATLQGAQRTQAPREQAGAGEKQAAANASKLKQLGGLNDRVQGLVNEQLANLKQQQQQPTTVAYNTAQLGTLDASVNQDDVKSLLSQYQQLNQQVQDPNADPTAKQQAQGKLNQTLADLKNNFNIDNPQDYLDLSTGRIGTEAAAGVMNPEEVKMSTLDTSQLGLSASDMDQLLGPGWQDLSLGQFKQRVEDVRQGEYSKIQGLQAQLATLEPGSAQRQLVEQQLRDLGQVGVTGVEQGVQKLQDQINNSDTVTVGGVSKKVEDLLKDDSISQMVADYLNEAGDPDFKKKLETEDADFVSWINEHKDALKTLTNTMHQSGEAFGQLQEQQSKLADVAPNVRLNDDVMKAITPDWGKAVGQLSDLADNQVYQAVTQDTGIASKLNADPTAVKALTDQGLSAGQIQQASKDADAVAQDADLTKILGFDPANPPQFLTAPEQIKQFHELAPVVSALRASGGQFNTMLADPNFQEIIKSGAFSGEAGKKDLDLFLKDPKSGDKFKQYSDYQNLLKEFDSIESSGSPDAALQFFFGDDSVSVNSLSSLFTKLKDISENDPTDTEARQRFLTLRQIFGDDGKLDAGETKSLIERIKHSLSETNGQGSFGGPVSFGNFIEGNNKNAVNFMLRDQMNQFVQPNEDARPRSSLYDTIKGALKDDGKISIQDLENMPPSERDKLWSVSSDWLKAHGVPSKSTFDYEEKAKEAAKARATADQDIRRSLAGWGFDPDKLTYKESLSDTERKQLTELYNYIKTNPAASEWTNKVYSVLKYDADKKAAATGAQKQRTGEFDDLWNRKNVNGLHLDYSYPELRNRYIRGEVSIDSLKKQLGIG